jgi:hypothetical protein
VLKTKPSEVFKVIEVGKMVFFDYMSYMFVGKSC